MPFPDFAKRHVGNGDFVAGIHVVGDEGDVLAGVRRSRELGGAGRNIPHVGRRQRQAAIVEEVRDASGNRADFGLDSKSIEGFGFFDGHLGDRGCVGPSSASR